MTGTVRGLKAHQSRGPPDPEVTMNDSSEQNASTRPSTTAAPVPKAVPPVNPAAVKGNEDVTAPVVKPATPAVPR